MVRLALGDEYRNAGQSCRGDGRQTNPPKLAAATLTADGTLNGGQAGKHIGALGLKVTYPARVRIGTYRADGGTAVASR